LEKEEKLFEKTLGVSQGVLLAIFFKTKISYI
jgi:hypothetical protein